jgi:small subunit ribosomal protein S17
MSEQYESTAGEGARRTMTGRVVSNKMQKTVSVAVERVVRHPVVGKYIRRTTKLLAHDEASACREGDIVSIVECRPISRRKSWRVAEILQRAEAQ